MNALRSTGPGLAGSALTVHPPRRPDMDVPTARRSPAENRRHTTLAASSFAVGEDAVERAIAGAAVALDHDKPALVLVFPDAGIPPAAVAEQLASAAERFPVAGMTSDMFIADGTTGSAGCAAMAFGSEVSAGVGLAEHASADARAAGRAAAEAAMAHVELVPGRAVMLLFVDPDPGDEAGAIDGAYAAVGGAVPLAGGGANGRSPCLVAGRRVTGDAVVAVAICSPEPIGVGLAHGCRP